MVSWHKILQPVVCVRERWRYVFLPFIEGNGPAVDEISMITAIHPFWGRTYFKLVGFGDARFDARGFRPIYPTIIDQLRKLDAPQPEHEWVGEDAR